MRKKLIYGAIAALVILFAAWMLWPRSLAVGLDDTDTLSAFVTTMGVEIVRDEYGGPFSSPTVDIKTYRDIAADSDAGIAIRSALDNFTYRLCLDSLTGKQDISNIGSLRVSLYGQDDWECSVYSGTGKCFLNGRIVKITGWGNENVSKLCTTLAELLQPLESEEAAGQ